MSRAEMLRRLSAAQFAAWETLLFLDTHPDFVMEPFSLPHPIGSCCGQLTLWPQRWGTDGFYICRMRRK